MTVWDTIDLVLVSDELASAMVQCGIHATEPGCDHRAIQATLHVASPDRTVTDRLPLKNKP